jgi:signal transduction histidine kinase
MGEVLSEVLARLAKAAQLSRAYIFENQIRAENVSLARLQHEWAAPGCAPLLADPAWNTLAYQAQGLGEWAQRLMAGETLAGVVSELDSAVRAFWVARQVKSVALAPIFSGGVWWGFLGFEDEAHEREWWPAELEAFKNTADALGAAFARQRSEAAEREERALAEALRDTLAALNSTLNFDEVLKRILDNVGRVAPHDAATVMLLKARVARIVRAEAHNDTHLDEHWAALRLPLDKAPHLRRILETGRSVAVADTETFPNWTPPPEAPWTRSYAGAPIKQKGRLIGFINLYSATPGFFTTSRVERLRAFTDQAGVALENAQFYEELERRVEERTRALAEANEQLKQLDKLKDQFISNVSHELRTPLTNIKLHLGLLDKRGPEALGRHLPTLQRETERLRGLIEDLLNLARLQTRALPPQREPFLLDELLAEVVAVHLARAEAKRLTLHHELNPTLAEVLLDRAEMMQVFNNLLGNAVAYTASGGHLEVSARAAKLGARQGVAIRFHNPSVIPPEDQPHLFERFYRGRTGRESNEPGTGLGLAICKEIVERHHGRIDVDSHPSHGTAFTVWVPLLGG